MKKYFILFLVSFLCFTCKIQKQVLAKDVSIVKIKKHPYLKDHCKMLVVGDNTRQKIERNMYCDPGSGCNSYLFETKLSYLLLDCNGNRFSINKQTGKIESLGWFWNNKLPENYIGTFIDKGLKNYSLIKEDSLILNKVYKFKDPN